jgi:hypothetical protein
MKHFICKSVGFKLWLPFFLGSPPESLGRKECGGGEGGKANMNKKFVEMFIKRTGKCFNLLIYARDTSRGAEKELRGESFRFPSPSSLLALSIDKSGEKSPSDPIWLRCNNIHRLPLCVCQFTKISSLDTRARPPKRFPTQID